MKGDNELQGPQLGNIEELGEIEEIIQKIHNH